MALGNKPGLSQDVCMLNKIIGLYPLEIFMDGRRISFAEFPLILVCVPKAPFLLVVLST